MICQNCGKEFENGCICPECQSDVILLNKARGASLKQYNKGVFYAKEDDYSAAINALSQCILFDKRNYVARNLLGISYYQVGLVGEALKQWVLSDNIQREKNPARKYINSLQKSGRILEKWDDAIAMYNKALTQFENGSEDLAIIGLKKAADISPNFVDALNLIAAYHISKGDKKKAKEYVDKALLADKRNPKSLEYLAEITTDKGSNKTSTGTGYNEKAPKKHLKSTMHLEIITFVAGIIVTAAVASALVVPEIKNSLSKNIDTLENQVAKLEDENINGTSKFAIKYSELEKQNQILSAENQKYKLAEGNKQQAADLQMALAYSAAGNDFEAAKLVKNLTSDNFSEEDKATISSLKQKTYPEAAKHYYDEGVRIFATGDNTQAETAFKTALEYGNKEDFIDDVLYNLGEISEEKGDKEQAKEYYGRVINEFAGSNLFTQAEEKLNALLSNV